ncbi:hypothetical protein [Polyangium sp. y55x31]|uniref:hypothetical protein n=1 Tax=Polyangium sp. y55x31 TaxID=3042688 RepID=UPI002482B21C|nr:hypothetical protein [Polyangium sp. y55x31]MDI1475515.1 hypothetical protein [Polyangium sp. y55x31]
MGATRQRRLGKAQTIALAGVAVLGTGAAAFVTVPELMLAHGTRQAKACLASIESPEAPEELLCRGPIEWMLLPARLPLTANRARYRAEELNARVALANYVEAAVSGAPDRLAKKADALDLEAAVVKNGSQRLAFDELGPSVGAPDLGREADAVGDRRTLIDRGETWLDFRVRIAAMRAALLEGDPKRAELLARRYADYDPRDHDHRTAIAAVLCMGLGDDPKRGFEMLPFVQDDRASRRYEGMSRDFGEVRALIIACAARVGTPPPPMPERPQAGGADAVEQRALLRLRLAASHANGEATEPVQAAIAAARSLLENGPRGAGARIALLAAVLAAGADLDADEVARLSRARDDEDPLAAPIAWTATEWLAERRPALGDAEPPPVVPGATFVAAARGVLGLEAKLRAPKEGAHRATAEALVAARGALWLEAAMSLAREGDAVGGATAADEAATALGLGLRGRALVRSNVFRLAGDREKAFAELAVDDAPAKDELKGKIASDPRIPAAVALQRAELAMTLGKREEARASAERAEARAEACRDVLLAARARWQLAALGARTAPPPSWADVEAGMALTWIGFGHPLEPYRAGDAVAQSARVARALDGWVGLAAADPALRHAGRWAALRDRGDAPPWLGVHLALAGRLLPPSEGDVETWLDAVSAFDTRRFSLRSYAFARADAARMRGDAEAAARWEARYRFLRGVASDPTRMELARHLDL